MKPAFKPGNNIAIKMPPHQFEQAVAFYRDVLGLAQVENSSSEMYESVAFSFGDKNLWVDKTASVSQAEVWLEIQTDDIEMASAHFKKHRIARRDEIEPLPEDFKGFWIAGPGDIIHLINE